MSSPIHHAKNVDAAFVYAPPWVREQKTREPLRPSAALAQGQRRRKPVALSAYEYSGDRDMARLQRQLTLNPERLPAPPAEAAQSWLPMIGRLCGVAAVAAAIAWVMISYPGVRLLRTEVVRVAASVPQPEIIAPKSDPLRTETGAELLMQQGLTVTAPTQPSADNQQAAATPPVAQQSIQTIPVMLASPSAVTTHASLGLPRLRPFQSTVMKSRPSSSAARKP